MTKSALRARMPQCSAFIDSMREAFGEPVGIKAEENGSKVAWGSLRGAEFREYPVWWLVKSMCGHVA